MDRRKILVYRKAMPIPYPRIRVKSSCYCCEMWCLVVFLLIQLHHKFSQKVLQHVFLLGWTSNHHPSPATSYHRKHIRAFNGFLKCMTWGVFLTQLKDSNFKNVGLLKLHLIKSPIVCPYFQHHWNVSLIAKLISYLHVFKRATPCLTKQSLSNPNLKNMQTCFWSSATREVWVLLAPQRPSRSSLPAEGNFTHRNL